MTSKRAKIETGSNTAASASLAAEVYDLLLEAGRKELEALLAVFVKASSKQALEAVRGEAIKRGAFVAVKQSRYQQCYHAQLDSFFSFLEPVDLRTADVVCRRWRAASKHSNAGWLSALSRPFRKTATPAWFRAIADRRIVPSQLSVTQLLFEYFSSELSFIGQLPSLTELHCHSLDWANFEIRRHSPLRSLTVSLTYRSELPSFVRLLQLPALASLSISFSFASHLEHLPIFTARCSSLTSLSLHNGTRAYATLPSILTHWFSNVSVPNLRSLTLQRMTLGEAELAAIATVSSLTALTLDRLSSWEPETAILRLSQLHSLCHLTMGFLQPEHLPSIAQLTQLERLDCRFHFGICIDNPDRPLDKLSRLHTLSNAYNLVKGALRAMPPSLTSFSAKLAAPEDLPNLDELKDCLPNLQTLLTRSTTPSVEQVQERVRAVRPQLAVLEWSGGELPVEFASLGFV